MEYKNTCPNCGGVLSNHVGECFSKDHAKYGECWVCNNCKAEGIEWHDLTFTGHEWMPFNPGCKQNVPPPTTTRRYKVQIPPYIRWSVFERDGYICKKCGSKINLHCDHIYPESLGGETVMENLQTLCGKCNIAKGSKVL